MKALSLIGFALFSAGEAVAQEPPLPRPPVATSEASSEPRPRPDAADGGALATEPSPCVAADIVAERLPPIEDPGACGLAEPVRVRSIAGVALDPPSVIACPLAHRVRDWLETSVKPAFAAQGAPLVGLDIAAAYVCRNVNYAEDGDVSEHAFGRALDISRFRRADGTVVSVLDDWGSAPQGGLLRNVHEDACGPFGTVLGPDSDPLHADHFHYDIAERRRPYCPSKGTDQSAN